MPYRPNFWHCTYCHPCGEEMQKMLDDQKPTDYISKWEREHPTARIIEKHLLGVATVHVRHKLVKDLEDHFMFINNSLISQLTSDVESGHQKTP